jgi:hypothetical protein
MLEPWLVCLYPGEPYCNLLMISGWTAVCGVNSVHDSPYSVAQCTCPCIHMACWGHHGFKGKDILYRSMNLRDLPGGQRLAIHVFLARSLWHDNLRYIYRANVWLKWWRAWKFCFNLSCSVKIASSLRPFPHPDYRGRKRLRLWAQGVQQFAYCRNGDAMPRLAQIGVRHAAFSSNWCEPCRV